MIQGVEMTSNNAAEKESEPCKELIDSSVEISEWLQQESEATDSSEGDSNTGGGSNAEEKPTVKVKYLKEINPEDQPEWDNDMTIMESGWTVP